MSNIKNLQLLHQSEIGMGACLRGLKSRGFNPRIVFDIGAAKGEWTKLALRYWETAQYTLFEPLIEREADLSNLRDKHTNVNYILAALGTKTEETELGVNKDNLYSTSLMFKGSEIRKVPQCSIDDLVRDRKVLQPDFMKIDVQGAQLLVLEGAKQTIKSCSLILLEVPFYRFSQNHSTFHEYIAWMAQNQFIPYEIVDVLRRPVDGAMGQCDLLFCRDGHRLMSDRRWNPGRNKPSMVDSSKIEPGQKSSQKLLDKGTQKERQRYMEKADELRQTGQLEEAILMYRRVIELEPHFSWSYHKIGEILSQQGKFNEAILLYKKAIELNSKSAWSHHFLGAALSKQGDWEQALVAYRKALSLNPNISWSHNGIGHILLEKNEVDRAIEEYQKAIQLNDKVEAFKIDLRRALELGGKHNIENSCNQLNILSNPQKFTYSKKSHFYQFKKFGTYQNVEPKSCDLKAYQDLLVYNFIISHILLGSKLLEIGGGNSRIIQELKNDYEIWNIDKLEGVGNGPKHIDNPTDSKLVQAYMGDFSPELQNDYFDFVFSISTLEHIPNDEKIFKNICDDINRVLKPKGFSFHAIDVVLKKTVKDNSFFLWTKGILPYIFNHLPTLNQMVLPSQIVEDDDLYVLSKMAYKRGWQPHTGKTYEDFGMPLSYQVIWQK